VNIKLHIKIINLLTDETIIKITMSFFGSTRIWTS